MSDARTLRCPVCRAATPHEHVALCARHAPWSCQAWRCGRCGGARWGVTTDWAEGQLWASTCEIAGHAPPPVGVPLPPGGAS